MDFAINLLVVTHLKCENKYMKLNQEFGDFDSSRFHGPGLLFNGVSPICISVTQRDWQISNIFSNSGILLSGTEKEWSNMSEVNFSSKAFTYAKNSVVQKSASEILLNLLSIQPREDVLDLGCGPGHITKKIAQITEGTVIGVDVSQGMIEQAISSNQGLPNLTYSVMDADTLELPVKFDVILCNSTFQWFQKPEQVLIRCFNALKQGGRIGIQAPATHLYCPNFVAAIEKIRNHPSTREVFTNFKNPWFFLESKEEYEQLFRNCGFDVIYSELREESNLFTIVETYKIYQSGAENGYLNQSFYTVTLTEDYISSCRELVKEAFKEQADKSGMIDLKFKRVYIISRKQ
jgi:trans-aconitate methyltransferase